MRVAVLVDRWLEGRGGAEAWLRRFAATAAAAGDEVLLATRDARDPRPGPPFAGWVRVPVPPGPRWVKDRAFAARAHAAAVAAGAAATLGVRHLHACTVYQPHGGVHRAALEGSLASLDGAASRVARRAVRAISPKQRVLLDAERRLLEGDGARAVVALSGRVLADLRRWFPAAAARARVVPPGVDLAAFRPGERERRGPPTALFLAADARLKGLAPLLEALALLRRGGRDLRLVAAGGFPAGPWRRRAERLGVAGAVSFPGRTDRPADLYRDADLLAHPTFYDPCSLVVLEALACGLPAVTTAANGAGEWIRPGAGEVLPDPRDARALAGALDRVSETARDEGTREAARRSAEAAEGPGRCAEILAILRGAVPPAGAATC